MKTTKKSLWLSAVSMLLCALMLLGTTFAWFTDNVTNTGNVIQAGTLDLEISSKDPLFTNNDGTFVWEPGRSQQADVTVSNLGSLWLKYTLSFTNVKIDDTVGEEADITEVLDVYKVDNKTEASVEDLIPANKLGTMAELMNQGWFGMKDEELAPNDGVEGGKDEDTFTLVIKMQEKASNEYQGATVTFDITAKATQAAVEEDGFGSSEYDKNANADVKFGEDIRAALEDSVTTTVVAGENIDLNNEIFRAPNGNNTFEVPDGKTLDLNGNAFIMPSKGSGNGLSFKEGTTAVVKNGTVKNDSDLTMVDVEYGANVTFENVDFVGFGDAPVRVRANGDKGEAQRVTVVFKSCTFKNAPVEASGMEGKSYVDIKFIDCVFTGTYKMYNEDGTVASDPYGHPHYTSELVNLRNYYLCGNVLFENCTMDFDAWESKYGEEAIAVRGGYSPDPGRLTVTLKSITIEGKKITPVEVDSRDKKYVTIAEEGTNSYIVNDVSVNYDGSSKG